MLQIYKELLHSSRTLPAVQFPAMSRGEKVYSLLVKVGGRWKFISDVKAPSQQSAYSQAIRDLPPEYYEKEIRIELKKAGDRKRPEKSD
jgi:hypothetical protein